MTSPTTTAAAAEARFILTIDIGSSSARVMLYDRRGQAVAGIGAQEHDALRPPPMTACTS